MRCVRLYLLFLSIASIGNLAFPQAILDPIDEKYLEHLVKEKIDSVRKTLSLKPLANDSILYIAAKYHAEYLKKIGKLSHFEKDKKNYETPQLRAKTFGAPNSYMVGENVALNYYLTPLKKNLVHTNYNDLATDIAKNWVNSKGHYQNIITEEYDVTGLALSVNRIDRSVYIVQKFADVLYQYHFSESKTLFPYSSYRNTTPVDKFDSSTFVMHPGKHSFKTKTPTLNKRYFEVNQYIDLDPKILRIEPKGRKIEVSTFGTPHLAEVIKKRRDGLAIEMVSYDDYACGNPEYYLAQSRRNYQDVYSGKLLKPVYKKRLRPKIKYSFGANYRSLRSENSIFKSFKKAFNPVPKKSFKTSLGKIPKNSIGFNEFNLVYLNKNQVSRVRHLSGLCGKPYKDIRICNYWYDDYADTLSYDLPIMDSTYRFYFERGISHYNIQDIKPLIYAGIEKYIIDETKISAFSSIEGLKSINERLQTERANSIAAALQSQQAKEIVPLIETSTNWRLFQKQFSNTENLSFLKKHDQAYQKIWIDSVLQSGESNPLLENLLDSQRYAEIQIKATYNWKEYKLDLFRKFYADFLEKYEKLAGSNQINPLMDYHALTLIGLIKHHVNSGTLNKETLYEFSPPWSRMFPTALSHYFTFLKEFDLENNKSWKELHQLTDPKNLNLHPQITHNRLVEEFRKLIDQTKVNEANLVHLEKKSLQLAADSAFYLQADTFLTSLYFYILNKKEQCINLDIFQRATAYIFETYHSRKHSNSLIHKVALLLVDIERYDLAYQLIEPYIDLDKPYLDLITLFTKLSYQNIQEFPETQYGEWLKAIHPLYPQEEWCALFIGPCNISFQVFDDKSVRDLYCESCGDYKNYVLKVLDGEIEVEE